MLATQGKNMAPEQRDELREKAAGDDVIMLLLKRYAPFWLAGLLGAGIMAAVMASDSQILALSTMFTEDVFAFYGGKRRFGEASAGANGTNLYCLDHFVCLRGRVAARRRQFLSSRFSTRFPDLLLCRRCWLRRCSGEEARSGARSRRQFWLLQLSSRSRSFSIRCPLRLLGRRQLSWAPGGLEVLTRTPGGTAVFGFMPVVPMVIISAIVDDCVFVSDGKTQGGDDREILSEISHSGIAD